MSYESPTTFLDLVQRTYGECGLVNNPPTSTVGQLNMARKVVSWVLDAHREIQQEELWKFDFTTLTFVSQATHVNYAPVADMGASAEGVKWWNRQPMGAYAYVTAQGVATRLPITFLDYEQFRGLNIPPVPGRPIYWTVKDDGNVSYFPDPNNTSLTFVHEVFLNPEVLADAATPNIAVPRMPKRFLMRIVWKAVQLYAGHDGAADTLTAAIKAERPLKYEMHSSQKSSVLSPGSLA